MVMGNRRRQHDRVVLQPLGRNVATLGVLLMLLVHLVVLGVWALMGNEAINAVYHEGGLSWAGVREGRVWQLVSHQWLHGGWFHLLANAFLFYYASARLSHIFGNSKILQLFLLTSVAAGLAHLASQIMVPSLRGGILVGASGGITGMLLGFFALSPQSRMLLLPVSARNLAKGFLISSALLVVMNPALGLPLLGDVGIWISQGFGEEIFQWAHLAHFVGGLTGWLCVERFLPKLLSSSDLEKMRREKEMSAELLGDG